MRRGVWVGLLQDGARPGANLELVALAVADVRYEDLPDAVREQLAHRMHAAVPPVEIADHAHTIRVRCPDGEVGPRHAADRLDVRAKRILRAQLRALGQQVQVEVVQKPAKAVRVVDLRCPTVLPLDVQPIVERQRFSRPPRHRRLEEVRRRPPRHFDRRSDRRPEFDLLRKRLIRPHHDRGVLGNRFEMRTEDGERIGIGRSFERDEGGFEFRHTGVF